MTVTGDDTPGEVTADGTVQVAGQTVNASLSPSGGVVSNTLVKITLYKLFVVLPFHRLYEKQCTQYFHGFENFEHNNGCGCCLEENRF